VRDLSPFLVLLWPLCALAWWSTLPVEVFSLSEDDFSRMLDAWAVSRGVLLPTDIWPPGPAWVAGLLILLGVPFRYAPLLVNLAALTASLALSVDLCRRLGVDRWVALLSALLVGMLHWTGWLGLSGLAEPLAGLCLVVLAHGVVRMGDAAAGGRLDARWQVSLAATFAGASRYECWAIAVLGAILLLVRRPDTSRRSLYQALLPLLFPVVWVALEMAWNDGVLDFAWSVRSNLLASEWAPKGGRLLLRPFLDLVDATGPLLPLAAVGAWSLREDRTIRALLTVWIASAVAYLAASLLGFAGLHNTPRLWLGHALLLPVGLAALWRQTGLRAVHVAALAVGLATRELPAWSAHPEGYTADVGWIAQAARVAMPVEGKVIVEAVPWECVSIKALIGEPLRTMYDRDPNAIVEGQATGATILSWTGGELLARLKAQDVRLVVTSRAATAERLERVAERRAEFGPHVLWEVAGP
jgi:hypothetical protein